MIVGVARRLARTLAPPLTLVLGLPAIIAATAAGRLEAAVIGLAATLAAAVAQVIAIQVNRRFVRGSRRMLEHAHLAIALVLAGGLVQLVIPTSFALYIPLVGLAAAMGLRSRHRRALRR